MNYYYTDKEISKTLYLLEQMSMLKHGQTLTSHYVEGYPFYTYVNRYGEITLSNEELLENPIFQFLKSKPEIESKVDLIELAWQYYFAHSTPNGDLILNNALFERLKSEGNITLLHLTNNLKEIEDSGFLHSSGGCLGASVYGVPLRKDSYPHNLATFLNEYELPKFLEKKGVKKNIDLIAIELEGTSVISSNMKSSGTDYLLLGSLQYSLYSQIKSKGKAKELVQYDKIEKKVVKNIKQARNFIDMCSSYDLKNVTSQEFVNDFEKAINNLHFLGYLYFEVILEYMLLYQNDGSSAFLHSKGEFNNFYFKQMVFELCPDLFNNFKLTSFRPKIKEITKYFSSKSQHGIVFEHFSESQFLDFFKWRFSQYIRYKLLEREHLPDILNFDTLKNQCPSILGQVLPIEIALDPDLNHFTLPYFELKADVMWKHWKNEQILMPYNSILPKGEVGINPLFENLKYKIFKAEFDNKSGKVRLVRELNVKLSSSLMNPRKSIMGTSTLNVEDKQRHLVR